MNYSRKDVADLEANLAWQEIMLRVEEMLKTADQAIENPDSFFHGIAVGERKKLRELKGFPETLRTIIENKGTPNTRLR